MGSSRSAVSFCREAVRASELDCYLAGLLLPNEAVRRCWFATRALNVELASVVGGVASQRAKEPASARLAWWRQSVIDICSGQRTAAHPVLAELQRSNVANQLSKSFLIRVLDARSRELQRVGAAVQFRSVTELEDFAEQVYASLAYVNLFAGGVKSVEADHCASHLAKAAYIRRVICGIKYHATRRQCFLPLDLCAEKKLSQESVYSLERSEQLCDVVLKLATQGLHHTEHACEITGIPEKARPFLLENIGLRRFYKRLEEKHQFDVFSASFESDNDPLLPFVMWTKSKFKKWQ